MSKNNLYVGRKAGVASEVFRSDVEPTAATHGERFAAVIGPFRTRRAAEWMAHPVRGQFNPHCRTVGDAERLAKQYASEYDSKNKKWPAPDPSDLP